MPFPDANPSLERALAERGYSDPTTVQAAVLRPDALGRDLLVSAQTGSGKTVAYGLSLADTLIGDAERLAAPAEPLALVVAPTRELALQVHGELTWLYGPAGGRVVSCVGGMDVRREQRTLADGCHIVVGTPGRLRDHLERGRLDTSALRAVVLDEADEMLDLGFREDLEFILDTTPPARRTLLFSATIPGEIAALARRYQRDAVRIDTLVQNQPHGDIEYRAIDVAPGDIEHAVVNVLRYFEARGALVFCHTREAVRRLHASLIERGFSSVALSGELAQRERSAALQSLRDGRARVCVATDVAARGIDLPDLGLVIHAELPSDRDTLLHRSGRTGRAGRKGVCVLLVPYTRRRLGERLLASAGVAAAWSGPPLAGEIRVRDQERLLADPAFTEELGEEELAMAQVLIAQRSPEQIASALVRLASARLPAPEEVFRDPPVRAARGVPERPADRGQRGGEDRGGAQAGVWFRMNVGRSGNADPRWLLPIICRLGHVTKKEVGAIRIFDRETRFEIAEHAAGRFKAALRQSRGEEEVRIEPAGPEPDGPAQPPVRKRGKRPGTAPRQGGPPLA